MLWETKQYLKWTKMFLLQIVESYPRLKADAVFGSEVEHSAVCSMKQIKSRCTILST